MTDDQQPKVCLECSATDDLVEVEAWIAGEPPDWFCQDVIACYARAREKYGLPI